MKSIGIIIIVVAIVALAALVLWVLQFVYLIMGWSKIKNGGLNGSPRAISEKISFRAEETGDEIEATEETVYYEPEKTGHENQEITESGVSNVNKKWLIAGGIVAGAALLFLIIWFAWLKPISDESNALQSFVYTWSADIYDTPDEENGGIVAHPGFGASIRVLEQDNETGWAKVSVPAENGAFITGYARINDLADFNHFKALERAGFMHEYVQSAIQSTGQRKAVMDYFLGNDADSIKTVAASFEGVCALSAAIEDGEDLVETFAFVVGRKNRPDELVVYTVDSDDVPHLYSKDKMPRDAEGIKDINGSIDDIQVVLTPAIGRKNLSVSMAGDNVEEITTPSSEEPEEDRYTHTYKGAINNRYAIEMTLTSDGETDYTGEYFYTKNKTPIQLRGMLTDGRLVLEEYVGMNLTGKFEGTLSRNSYSGTWTSSDGKTSYPFSVYIK